jgi:methylene-fatty-acyl-phospholipid synthase
MSPEFLIVAAVALGLERATYVWIAQAPASFRRWCARRPLAWLGEPVAVVETLFLGFKGLQALVFLHWCLGPDGERLVFTTDPLALGVGAGLIAAGQVLNWSVFQRLGRLGVFFGDRLGHPIPWVRGFPFSLVAHPQYTGAVLTIWGVFLTLGYPREGWYVLPMLETAYYIAGAHLEARKLGHARWSTVAVGCPDSAR